MFNELYKYQFNLPNWGKKQQSNLSDSVVAVIGCGGLGSHSAPMLASAGIGNLVLIDNDIIELSNIHRQNFNLNQVGKKKVKILKNICKKKAKCKVFSINERIQKDNISILKRYNVDLILDCSDNWETRHLIDSYCSENATPFIYSAVSGVVGSVKVVMPQTLNRETLWEQYGISSKGLKEIFGDRIDINPQNKDSTDPGILPTMLPLISSIQVSEALKILTNNYAYVNLDMISFNLWDNKFRIIKD